MRDRVCAATLGARQTTASARSRRAILIDRSHRTVPSDSAIDEQSRTGRQRPDGVVACLFRLLRTDRLPKTIEWPHRRSRQRKWGLDHGYGIQTIELRDLSTADGIRCPRGGSDEMHGVCGRGTAAKRNGASPLDHERFILHGEGENGDDRSRRLGPGGWPAAQSRRVEVEVALDRGRCTVTALLRGWNCRNCGRRNKTLVAGDGIAQCEYCAGVATVRPLHHWGRKVLSYASLLFSLTIESIRWRPAPARARAWRPKR